MIANVLVTFKRFSWNGWNVNGRKCLKTLKWWYLTLILRRRKKKPKWRENLSWVWGVHFSSANWQAQIPVEFPFNQNVSILIAFRRGICSSFTTSSSSFSSTSHSYSFFVCVEWWLSIFSDWNTMPSFIQQSTYLMIGLATDGKCKI